MTNPDTTDTIQLPDRSGGEEIPTPTKPDEHVPPLEVPGRPETPEHVPERSQ